MVLDVIKKFAIGPWLEGCFGMAVIAAAAADDSSFGRRNARL
jgi:hypothetical protein